MAVVVVVVVVLLLVEDVLVVDVAVEVFLVVVLIQLSGQCPHLPRPEMWTPSMSVNVEHHGLPSSAPTKVHSQNTTPLTEKGKTQFTPGSAPLEVTQSCSAATVERNQISNLGEMLRKQSY